MSVPPPPPGSPSSAWPSPYPPTPQFPGGAYPGQSRPTTSGLAIAALITGLAFWCFVIPGIVAVVLGYLALEQIDNSNGMKTGRGMALAGIILGWIGIALVGVAVVSWIAVLLTS
jgi:uncharacterized membrane protein